ncbi:MAG: hypothetical protein OWU84_00200 [Firmicutes bacterium]|nr:hypothetical protein [Bacillota bacterium]
MAQFISEPVAVHYDERHQLRAFQWQGRTFAVAEIWSDVRTPDFRGRWWQRRHRRRVVVRTEDNRWFELYVQRPGEWVLYRELDNPLA